MLFRLVDSGWEAELTAGLAADPSHLRIVCPFIKKAPLARILKVAGPERLQVVTRFNLAEFADGVSDLGALKLLLDTGASVRGARNLHAKLYVFGRTRSIVTSANLTNAALRQNHELGCVAEDEGIVLRCIQYFDSLWDRAGPTLTPERLAKWIASVDRDLVHRPRREGATALVDYGADVGIAPDEPASRPLVDEAPQWFVKLLGEATNRVPLDFPTIEEVRRAGCNWTVAYPASKRPTGVKDGAVVFMGRLTKDPDDIRIFGRAIAVPHTPGRDDASAADIRRRPWMKKWPRFLRVHHAEFVSGSMRNGVSLYELMEELQAQAFASTERNARRGSGNTNPRVAYRQQPAVELTAPGADWLNRRFESSLLRHGRLQQAQLDELDED